MAPRRAEKRLFSISNNALEDIHGFSTVTVCPDPFYKAFDSTFRQILLRSWLSLRPFERFTELFRPSLRKQELRKFRILGAICGPGLRMTLGR